MKLPPKKAFLYGLLTEFGGVGILILGLILGWLGPCGPHHRWQYIPLCFGAAIQLPAALIIDLLSPEWTLSDYALDLTIVFCQVLFWTMVWHVILILLRSARTRKVTTHIV